MWQYECNALSGLSDVPQFPNENDERIQYLFILPSMLEIIQILYLPKDGSEHKVLQHGYLGLQIQNGTEQLTERIRFQEQSISSETSSVIFPECFYRLTLCQLIRNSCYTNSVKILIFEIFTTKWKKRLTKHWVSIWKKS